ncbi:MAG TPA: hypothetical protein VHB98_21450 [Chloroflexota bacterium]|jgi:hypothetical protein|nr:hypothetical protein [Chloroflexota bacterium]
MDCDLTRARRAPALQTHDDRWLLGYPLALYQQAHQLDDKTLAGALGITVHRLNALRMCPRPWPDPYQIRLARIVDSFGLNLSAFAHIITEGDLCD